MMAADTQNKPATTPTEPGEYDLGEDAPAAGTNEGNLPPTAPVPDGEEEKDDAIVEPDATEEVDAGGESEPPKGDESAAPADANAALVADAQELGFSEPIVHTLDAAGQLADLLADIESSALETGRAAIAAEEAAAKAADAPEPVAAAPAPVAPVAPTPAEEPEFEFKFGDESLLEPETRDQLEALNKHHAARNASLTAEVAQLKEQFGKIEADSAARQKEAEVQEWDEFFADLPEQYQEAVGTGRLADLDPNGPQAKKRLEVAGTMRAFVTGYAGLGRPASFKLIKQAALRAEFPKLAKSTDRKAARKVVQERDGRYSAPPTRRRSAPEKGDAAALANIANKLDEHGASSEEEDDAGLLDY